MQRGWGGKSETRIFKQSKIGRHIYFTRPTHFDVCLPGHRSTLQGRALSSPRRGGRTESTRCSHRLRKTLFAAHVSQTVNVTFFGVISVGLHMSHLRVSEHPPERTNERYTRESQQTRLVARRRQTNKGHSPRRHGIGNELSRHRAIGFTLHSPRTPQSFQSASARRAKTLAPPSPHGDLRLSRLTPPHRHRHRYRHW